MYLPFNRFDDRGPNADPNVAFAWQSRHRPIVRNSNYGLDGAFPTQLQPSLLRVYKWVSTRWHEFLGHDVESGSMPGHLRESISPVCLGSLTCSDLPHLPSGREVSQPVSSHSPSLLIRSFSPETRLPLYTLRDRHEVRHSGFPEPSPGRALLHDLSSFPTRRDWAAIPETLNESGAKTISAESIFIRLDRFPVVVCRRCKYAVWPREILNHLKGVHHQLSHVTAKQIAHVIQQWEGLLHNPAQLALPPELDVPIAEVPVYPDRLLCQRDRECHYAARSLVTMRRN